MGLIEKKAHQYGLNPAWMYGMMLAESGGNPNIPSKKGALGLMQVMPSTAAAMKITGDLRNPEIGADAGMRYFKDLLGQFGGDYDAATMAYNEGPTAYKQGHRYDETKNYLKKVQASAGMMSLSGYGEDHSTSTLDDVVGVLQSINRKIDRVGVPYNVNPIVPKVSHR
jgi:soluble lytic murein transglycosylase-like protein